MEINFGDLFIHVPTHSLHQCVGSDDELVWYIPKGESESKWFDVGDCSKDPSDLFTETSDTLSLNADKKGVS